MWKPIIFYTKPIPFCRKGICYFVELDVLPSERGGEVEPSWKDKPLHGMYHRRIEEVADIEKSNQ